LHKQHEKINFDFLRYAGRLKISTQQLTAVSSGSLFGNKSFLFNNGNKEALFILVLL